MHSAKQGSPAATAAIQAFLEAGGQITRVPPTKHGECLRRKGIQFRGKDTETVRAETEQAAQREQQERMRHVPRYIREHRAPRTFR